MEVGHSALVAALATPRPGHFLILGEPVPGPTRRRGLAKMLPSRPPAVRFTQVMRLADDEPLLAEAVGATSFGGHYDLDDATDRAVRALGWLGPGDPDWEEMGGPLYRRWLPREDPAAVADLLLRTLDAMGVDRSDLEIQTGP